MLHHNTADSRPAIKVTTGLPDENALLIASGIQIRCRRSHSTQNRLLGSAISRKGGQPTRRGYAPSRRTCQTGGRHTHVNSQPRGRGRSWNETLGRVRPKTTAARSSSRCTRRPVSADQLPGTSAAAGDRTSQETFEDVV